MPSQPMFSLWTPLLKTWLCLEAHQSGRQITGDIECQGKDGTKIANRTSGSICTPWFKVEAAVLKNEQCLAFDTFLLPSITPIAAFDNYKVQKKSLTGLQRVVRHHHATNQAKLAEQAYFDVPAPVALANDNAIVEIGRVCKPLPEPITTTAADYSSGRSSFESVLSCTRYNKNSPRSFPSCSNSSTQSECWPDARMVSSSAGPPISLDSSRPPMGSGQGTFMISQQPSINNLAQIDPAIIANPVQRKLSRPQTPSPADRATFEALLEVGIENSGRSWTTQTSKVTQMVQELPKPSSTASQEKVCLDSNAIREVGHPCSPSPFRALRDTEDLSHTLPFAMTDGSYEPKTIHSPSVTQDEKLHAALSGAEIFRDGHSPEHMSLFQVLIDGLGSQSRSEALDWLNIDRCHYPGHDTEIEELDLSRPQYRTPRAGKFRGDLISCRPSTLEAGTESRKAAVDDEVDSLDTASHGRVDPNVEIARTTMVSGEEIKRAVSTRNDDLCTNVSRSAPDTDEVEENQADGKTSLVTPPVLIKNEDEDPLDRILDDARRNGGSSYTIRSALKDAIFCRDTRRSDPKVEKRQTQATVPRDTVKAAKAGPHRLSQFTDRPTDIAQEGRKKGADPKLLRDTARPSQSITSHSTSEDRNAKQEGIIKWRSPKHSNSSIPGRAQGNRARFMWIPHDRFNAVEVQVSKSASGVEAIRSEIDAEDPFAAEEAVYSSHTRCQLALAHVARMLEARLGRG